MSETDRERQFFAVGQIFTVESGCYSDYRIHGIGMAVQAMDVSELMVEFLKDHGPRKKCGCQTSCLDLFIRWLEAKGIAREIDYETILED